MEMTKTVLQVKNLHKKFKDFELKNISLSLEAGYIMGFIGRNGSGKTTVMKLIQNVIVKNSGTVTICGYDNRKQEIKAKNEIGFVADECPFVKIYSLFENADLFGKYYKNFNREHFSSLLSRFGLDGNQKVLSLSKGMESRFQLAFALAHDPKLLIMDEPNDGLDPIFRRDFLSLLQELVEEEEMGIIFSTHITGDLDKVADYITLIDQGELVFTQDKESLMERYRILKGDLTLLKRIPADAFIGVRRYREGFEAMTEMLDKVKPYLQPTDNMVVQRATLEDIMYYYNKRRRANESIEGI